MSDLITTTQDTYRNACIMTLVTLLTAGTGLVERARDPRGQTAAEYMGVILLVSLIILARRPISPARSGGSAPRSRDRAPAACAQAPRTGGIHRPGPRLSHVGAISGRDLAHRGVRERVPEKSPFMPRLPGPSTTTAATDRRRQTNLSAIAGGPLRWSERASRPRRPSRRPCGEFKTAHANSSRTHDGGASTRCGHDGNTVGARSSRTSSTPRRCQHTRSGAAGEEPLRAADLSRRRRQGRDAAIHVPGALFAAPTALLTTLAVGDRCSSTPTGALTVLALLLTRRARGSRARHGRRSWVGPRP